ncbi:MAG TPA: NAD(P)H-binding protein [Bryobacteraceae bacterium]|nr:NAD(P)H-binding protein [Bryobacteraceae bacterium]
MKDHVAVVAGATGMTGRYLVEMLCEDAYFDKVVALVRRPGSARYPKLEERMVDFGGLDAADLEGATHLFCCLGTTMKRAGSKEAFRQVDLDYVTRFAEAGRAAGAGFMALVSSVGADEKAGSFYLKVKGEAERRLEEIGFEALHIFRPSILLGKRDESRPGEEWGIPLARAIEWMLVGDLRKYRPMPAGTLAAAMAAAGERGGTGIQVHTYEGIVRLAGG